jgi:SNF2 family DNA or RNA helicase
MSGNPIPKSPDEIFAQYRFLDAGIYGSYFYSFIDRYCEVDYFNKVTSLKNEQEFHSKLHSVSFRKTKQECLNLPPKIYEKEIIEMTPEQKQLYKTMEKDAIASYKDKTCAATVVIAKFLRLSQIAGGFFPDNEGGGEYLFPNRKLDRLVEIISELPETEQFVIWARFRKEIEIIDKTLRDNNIPCVTFYGETSYKEKGIARELFRDKKVRGFIGNPASGGKGLNDLIGATTVIYYSNDYSSENRMQSEDRNHRNGTVKVLYIDLLMKDTIDKIVLDTVRQNIDFANTLLNRMLVLD